jgi:hypothetical protein
MPHDVWHSRVTRQIAHVKITYAPGEPVVAKAYLRAAFDLLAGGTLLRGRPRLFGATAVDGAVDYTALRFRSAASPGGAGLVDGALAPSDGGAPPSAVAGADGTAPQLLDRPAVRSRALDGTAVALAGRELTGETGMTRSTAHSAHKEALEQILTRAAVDLEFRKALLVHPRKAILDGLGVRIPAKFRVKFIEREKDVDALIVLPDLQRHDCELDDGDLDGVSGGGDLDPSETW